MYIRTDDNNNIVEVISVGVKPTENGYEVNPDEIPLDVLKDIFKYKFINNEFIKNDNIMDSILEEVRNVKIQNMSAICNKLIENGISFNGENYSLKPNDQINLMKLETVAKLSPTTPIFYHADGQMCRQYSANEIINITETASAFIEFHTTYFNMLKAQIKTINDTAAISVINYGDALTGEFKTAFEQITSGFNFSISVVDDSFDPTVFLQKFDMNILNDIYKKDSSVMTGICDEGEISNETTSN